MAGYTIQHIKQCLLVLVNESMEMNLNLNHEVFYFLLSIIFFFQNKRDKKEEEEFEIFILNSNMIAK